jgi:homocysteine S-methyltransferase
VAATSSARVVAVGVNCTAPEHVQELLERARAVTDRPLVAYPNNGRVWDAAARAWSSPGAAALPDAVARGWAAAGARLVGGCCGLGPPAVRAIARALAPS